METSLPAAACLAVDLGGGNMGKGCLWFLILILAFGASWIITCGLIALICLCFGWTFNWAIATGLWIVILLLRSIFSSKG